MLKRRKDRKKGGSAKPEAADVSSSDAPAKEETLNARAQLGEMLVQEGIVSEGQLNEALKYQQDKGGFLGNALIALKLIDQNALVSFLVKQCKIPHISLLDYGVNEDLFQLVPKELCLKHLILPIDRLGRILTVAMVNPFDAEALETVRSSCPDLKIKPILCDYNHFDQVARKHLNASSTTASNTDDVSAQSFGLSPAAPKPRKESSRKAGTPAPKPARERTPAKRDESANAPGVDPDILGARIEGAVASAVSAAMAPLISRMESMQQWAGSDSIEEADISNVERFPGIEGGGKAERSGDDVLAASGVGPSGSELVRNALFESSASATFSFDDFAAGSANNITESLIRGLTTSRDAGLSPMYLCAGVGLGKTHLLHAIGNEFAASNRDMRVCRMTGGMFARGCESSRSSGGIRAFLESISTVDVFLLDDVHTLAGQTEAQAAFVEVFDAFYAAARPLVITGLKACEDQRALDPQLASRLSGAVVATIAPPDFDARMEILRRRADASGVDISDEVLVLIAERVKDDVRRLKGAFEKVAAYMRVAGGGVSADEAREMIVQFDAEAVA